MRKVRSESLILVVALMVILLGTGLLIDDLTKPVTPGETQTGEVKPVEGSEIQRFKSGEELVKAFEEARNQGGRMGMLEDLGIAGGVRTMAVAESAVAPASKAGVDYSETNIQVEGVDEADIIKTDGTYIYTLSNGNLVIARAYPASRAEILSTTDIDNFYPQELFIHQNKLLVFGSASYDFNYREEVGMPVGKIAPDWYPRYMSVMSVKLFDITDRDDPELIRTIDFEGSYLTSRKIGEHAYFVVNSYPRWPRAEPMCDEIIPLYRDVKGDKEPTKLDFEPVVKCVDIGYIPPIQAQSFITIASVSMDDGNVEKEVIVGSGQNVYASLGNLYVAQTSWPRYNMIGELAKNSREETVVSKFALNDGEITFLAKGEVNGHILNQFSMDEWDEHFRIATTSGNLWGRGGQVSSNNVYVLDEDMDLVGELEDLAPGEKIYSVRFMGKRGYVVTFKKVDPLFVIDLEDHEDPDVLGKLKIPGYSDYLHPYDENHIIGIGKDTVEAEDELVERRQLDFAWYQGIKMAIFDVSDVENPIEMDKVIIGDRGTESEALHNHKAFLFDREKELLVIPITLAQIKGEKTRDNQYGETVFQGAFVFDVNLKDGFSLRGKVTHYDDDDVFKKAGFYFRGNSAIRRSLYIGDVLYTLSNSRLQLNDLDDLDRLKVLEFEEGDDYPKPIRY